MIAPSACLPSDLVAFCGPGSLVCPVYDSLEGPYAASLTTIAQKTAYEEDLKSYPFCPVLEENEDLMMISEYSSVWDR